MLVDIYKDIIFLMLMIFRLGSKWFMYLKIVILNVKNYE